VALGQAVLSRDSGAQGLRQRQRFLISSQVGASLSELANQTSAPLKLCLPVDGLDAYNGDHKSLATLLQGVASTPNIKACLFSRLLLACRDAFECLPQLRLQDLAFEDIKRYVNDNLGTNKQYKKPHSIQTEAAATLVDEIVSKADGVFLWVALIATSLLDGLTNHDSIKDLQRRLWLLPSDLESLYRHMLFVRIDEFYRLKTSQLFQIFRATLGMSESLEQPDVWNALLVIHTAGTAFSPMPPS
jgi:hypothetical protein